MSVRARHAIGIALASAVAALFTGMWLWNSGFLDRVREGRSLTLVAPDAGGVAPGSSVRIAGLKVGHVTKVDRQGDGALITTRFTDIDRAVPVDTQFAVRLRTLAGEHYIALYPGRRKTTVPDKGVLGMSHAKEYVDADQVLSVFRGRTRTRARQLVGALATAVGDRGRQLNHVVGGFSDLATDINPVLNVVSVDRANVGRIVANLGALMAAVGDRSRSIRSLATDFKTTLTGVATRDAAVRETIARLPGTLDEVRATTGTLDRVSRNATPIVTNLASALVRVRPAVGALGPASKQTRALLRELSLAEPGLETTARRLRTVAPGAIRALPQVTNLICQVQPMAHYLEPYGPDIISAVVGLGSATNWYDATGHAARLLPTVGEKNPVVFDPTLAKIADQLLQRGVELAGLKRSVGYTPLMKPGGSSDTETGRGVIGPSEVKQKYPHLEPTC